MNRINKTLEIVGLVIFCYVLLCAAVWIATSSAATSSHRCYARAWIAVTPQQQVFYEGPVRASNRTSCRFARRVYSASMKFIIRHGGEGDGDFYTRAYSPVTQRYYRMHCWANGSLYTDEGMHVDCRGGSGARVVYAAWSY